MTSFFHLLLIATSVSMAVEALTITDAGMHLISTDSTLEWPSYQRWSENDEDDMQGLGDNDDEDESAAATKDGRSSLFWWRVHQYYISYGALSANRIPCPPRSGRSYYTHNCYHARGRANPYARGRANPYTRGCSAITRCRR